MKRIVAVNTNCYHGYTTREAIDGIRDAGFRYVELTATKGWTEHVFPTMRFVDLYRVQDRLREAKLVPFAMSGHTNLMDTERIGDFLDNMRLAAFFGCDYIVSSIGEAHLEDQAVAGDEEVAAHVRNLLPRLEACGLTLALENHGEHGTGRRLKSIVDLVGSPRVRINYDTANAVFYGDFDRGGLLDDITACVSEIGFMHVKDKAGARNEWNFPALGAGYIDFPAIFGILEAAGNNCPLSIEIEFGPGGPQNLAEVNEAVRASKKYLAKIGIEGPTASAGERACKKRGPSAD